MELTKNAKKPKIKNNKAHKGFTKQSLKKPRQHVG